MPPESADRPADFLDAVDWGVILDGIRTERCILCVGPNVYTGREGTLDQQLAAFLRREGERLRIRVYDDGWFHYLQDADYIRPWRMVKEFYRQPFERAERIFRRLAPLPFHLFISATPDYRLRDAFVEQGLPHRFYAYHKKEPYEKEMAPPSQDDPVIYNLLGELDYWESLVLTYDDFYDYLQSVFAGNSMSPVLKEAIQKRADTFLFLGLPFDKWYMHLFLRILNQHRLKLPKYAPGMFANETVSTYCREQFNITFVPARTEVFVEELYARCAAAGLLRTPREEAPALDLHAVRSLLRRGELAQALDRLIGELTRAGTALRSRLDEAVLLESRFQSLENQRRRGLVTDADHEVRRATAAHDLLELLTHLEG